MTTTFTPSAPVPVTTPRARRTWATIGLVLAVTALGFGTFQVVDVFAFARVHFDTTLRGDVRVVEIRTNAGSIHLQAGAPGVAHVVGSGSRGLTVPHHAATLTDGRLVVDGGCHGGIGSYCTMRVTVTVPPDAALDLRSSGGRVTVDAPANGARWTGAITAGSSDGRVEIANASGPLHLHSSAARVVGTGLTSTDVDATSSGGRVVLSFDTPPTNVTARSSAARVIVEVPRTSDEYVVDASSSASSTKVSVRSNPAATRRITAHSSGGRVEVRYRG